VDRVLNGGTDRTATAGPAGENADGDAQPIVVGVVASPGPVSELVRAMLPSVSDRVASRLPGVRWDFRFASDRLVDRPAELSELIAATRRRMLEEGWHAAVLITDLPLRSSRRPVVAHASAAHSVAVLSLPALGPVAVTRRAADAVLRLLGMLVGDDGSGESPAPDGPRSRVTRRLLQLRNRAVTDERGVRLLAGVVAGNLRLLLGMLRANRPWRLAVRLSRLLVAAVGTATVALVTSDIWRLSDGLGAVRLTILTVGSVLGIALTLVIGADLWERTTYPPAREQVVLFNVVTVTTVVIGVVVFYTALFVLALAGCLALVPGAVLSHQLGHHSGVPDEIDLAWLATSLATVGGALGAGLETDDTVREAAYSYQPDPQLTAAPTDGSTPDTQS
jgi:hypothetical protein